MCTDDKVVLDYYSEMEAEDPAQSAPFSRHDLAKVAESRDRRSAPWDVLAREMAT
jgi:hypothetical protein